MKVTDPAASYDQVYTLKTTDSVFCGEVVNNIGIAGCGDGSIIAYNVDDGDCLYGYGCDPEGGVQCLMATDDRECIVTGGDSGTVMRLDF